MTSIASIAANPSLGLLSKASVNIRTNPYLPNPRPAPEVSVRPSARALQEIHRLRRALEAIKPKRLNHIYKQGPLTTPEFASAVSLTSLNLGSNTLASVSSVEEVNTAPTSFTQFGPDWNGSTVTAPWSGPGSTADATVRGTYDGSNGSGTLTFRVRNEGTHGEDDLRIKVYAPDDSFIENIDIDKDDPLDTVYVLSNGLQMTLSAGELVKNEEFTVNTELMSTSFMPTNPGWMGSTAQATIGGTYNGDQGSGTLTFRVQRAGVHGEDDLKVRLFAPDDSVVETIDIKKNDPLDKVYSLSNGLTFELGAGELIKHETLEVHVDAADPSATNPIQPVWQVASAEVTLGGTYDGSLGTGALTFRATTNGVHGEDDLRIKVFAPDGSHLQNIDIDKDDLLDQVYTLSNGLTLTLGPGELIKNETLSVDLQTETTFSTDPNPVESTALATIGGIYDGSVGTGSLSFLVTQGGVHGVDDLELQVFAPDESLLDTVSILHTDALDQVYTLSNGLNFSLSAGTLVVNETFTVQVDHQVGSSVNPDLPFNGIRNSNPNFDLGTSVTDGSFTINGMSIDVFANDTLNSVLDRINLAGLDVTAEFDATTDTVILTRNTAGATLNVILDNDTSGFLAATKLASATPTPGDGSVSTPLKDVASFSSISSGTIQINGVSISVDVDTDSLDNILSRINASAANVTAQIDSETNQVSIVANVLGEDIVLSSGGTGFFPALDISDGIHLAPDAQDNKLQRLGFGSQVRRELAAALAEAASAMNKLLEEGEQGLINDPYLAELRQGLRAAIVDSFDADEEEFKTEFGVRFDLQPTSDRVFRFSNSDKDRLYKELGTERGAQSFREFMFGDRDELDGLAERLIEITKQAEKDWGLELGSAGLFVDLSV